MNFQKLKLITSIAAIAMLLHTVEEYITKLWNYDHFILNYSHRLQLNPMTLFFWIQGLVFVLIFFVLFLEVRKKYNIFLGIILGLVFLLELLHPYNSIMIMGYYSGLYTGIVLIVVGYFYWKELISYLKNIDSSKKGT